MKIIILLLTFILSACSSEEYSLSYISKDDGDNFFDDKGQQWVREETDDSGAKIEGGKLIKKNTNSFCFTDRRKIDALISRSSSANNDQDIRWYAKFSSTKNEEYILFGENQGDNFVKINSTTYKNKEYPISGIYTMALSCQNEQREKRARQTREEFKRNKIYDGVNFK